MTMKGKTLLKGHTLVGEGQRFASLDCEQCDPPWPLALLRRQGGPGHGRCSCGAVSPHLDSQSKRKRWHREVHKDEIRATAKQA